ncbi:hypothetical protein AVEN_231130-1 [Araneus ventricosus]|uniref:Uncharacterized protein n=1 Tax=Araneus ventricosus TaxID=182803 RepID=A0A4Y2UYR1_ARAVE|nr:hypothetical protein AVEN_231130-1 [Araneus ventricosus]
MHHTSLAQPGEQYDKLLEYDPALILSLSFTNHLYQAFRQQTTALKLSASSSPSIIIISFSPKPTPSVLTKQPAPNNITIVVSFVMQVHLLVTLNTHSS